MQLTFITDQRTPTPNLTTQFKNKTYKNTHTKNAQFDTILPPTEHLEFESLIHTGVLLTILIMACA